MGKNSRETAIMNNETDKSVDASKKRTTAIIEHDAHRTAILGSSQRRTFIAPLSVGQEVCGLLVERVMAENTGEATLLLGKTGSEHYVIKLYHSNKQPKEELADILSKIDCPYITCSIETGTYEGRYFEVLPYYSSGDLAAQNRKFNEGEIESVIIPSVNNGLKALHDNGIVHRDIKPSNIFLSDTGDSAIIGDFGISSTLHTNVSVRATTMSRTFGYAAPETTSGFISKESDYYSFGITLLHLITGQDPFAGMTDMQIVYQTMTQKLVLPGTISERFSLLIRGLTLKERTDRWGYDEVCRWLRKENVAVVENRKTNGMKPYSLNKERYYNLEDLSKAFVLDWESAKKHLYRGLIEKNILQYGEDLASNCIDLKEIADKDVAVFRLIYLLNPDSPLCYKGKFYNDLEHLANEMYSSLPKIDPDIYELLSKGCLEYYLKLDNAYELSMVKEISLLLHELQKGKQEYYYAIMYFLNPHITYKYEDVSFDSAQSVADYLSSLDEFKEKQCAKTLIDSSLFSMWLASLGYSEVVEEWKRIYENEVW